MANKYKKPSDSWVWKHFLKLNDFIVQCNTNNCNVTYQNMNKDMIVMIRRIKIHLYQEHNIWTEEDRLKWENDNNSLWEYFDKEDLYKAKCKICKNFCHQSYIPNLRKHLRKHNQEIIAAIQEKMANKSLSQYFEIHEEKFIAKCKYCNSIFNIFYETDTLIYHIQRNHCLRYRNQLEDNNVNGMTQQFIANENTSTSSHHDNINRQAPGNRENEQSNTLLQCADIMAARETSGNWMWKHVFKLDDDTIQCNVDNCGKTYRHIRRQLKYWIKIHLYHTHKIWAEEDRLKWENNNDPIWQYFDKIDLYKGKCKFCKKFYREAYLKRHLHSMHSQELRADVQKEIAIKSLSQSFKIDEKECSIQCKCYNHKMDIFDTDTLTYRTCSNNYVNRMTQQSTATENENTSSHHDDVNNQPQSRENHQRSISNKPRFSEGIADNNMYKITPQFIAVGNMTASNYENTNCQNPRIQEVEQSFKDIVRDGMIPSVIDEHAGINSYYAYTNWQAFHNQDQ